MSGHQPFRFAPAQVLLLAFMLWAAGAAAAAQSSNAFLDIGTGARAVAMGEAFVGLADDVSSVYWNPAGLAKLPDLQAMLMHNQWLQGVLYEYGAFGLPMPGGGLGLAVTYVSYGTMDKLDEFGNPAGTFTATDLNATAAYGLALTDHLALGAALKAPVSTIDGTQQISVTGDAGVLFRIPGLEALQLGLMSPNLFATQGATPDYQLKLGLGLIEPVPGLKAAVDVSRRLDESTFLVNVGAEYFILGTLAPRIGYKFSSTDTGLGSSVAGLTAGMGLRYATPGLALELDYAYVPFGDLGDTHRLALQFEFGQAAGSAIPTAPAVRHTAAAPPAPMAAAPMAAAPPAASGQFSEVQGEAATPPPAYTPPVPEALLPPTGVKLARSGKTIKLAWSASTSSQRVGYEVFMKADKGEYKKINPKVVTATVFKTQTLKTKHTYSFVIRTVDQAGNASMGTTPEQLRLK